MPVRCCISGSQPGTWHMVGAQDISVNGERDWWGTGALQGMVSRWRRLGRLIKRYSRRVWVFTSASVALGQATEWSDRIPARDRSPVSPVGAAELG